jgi:hypothetical protein
MGLTTLPDGSSTVVPSLRLSVKSTFFTRMNNTNDTAKSMVNTIKTYAFFLTDIVFFTGPVLFAQLPDGTRSTVEWIDEIKKNRVEEEILVFNETTAYHTADLSVIAHVIRDVNGMNNCTEEDIKESIAGVNSYFAPIHVVFHLKPVQYSNDYNYSSVSHETNLDEWLKTNSTEKTINLYLVESAKSDTIPCYGFTYFPNDTLRNFIFLDKRSIQGNYLVTLMGHFFGLLSTHDTLGGYENANEDNCAESGDFLCDTWADPGLFGIVDSLCTYTGALIDQNGQDYVPSVANLMSESNDPCKCVFTNRQYRRMLFCLEHYRGYLR